MVPRLVVGLAGTVPSAGSASAHSAPCLQDAIKRTWLLPCGSRLERYEYLFEAGMPFNDLYVWWVVMAHPPGPHPRPSD